MKQNEDALFTLNKDFLSKDSDMVAINFMLIIVTEYVVVPTMITSPQALNRCLETRELHGDGV